MKKEKYVTFGVVILILAISVLVIYLKSNPGTQITEQAALCIGQNSVMYSQTGCSHCKDQEDMFGPYVSDLNIVDCLQQNNTQKCIDAGILGTPTWVIKNQSYEGVHTIEKLKQLTGC
jgi:glutaredoxin